MKRRIAQRSAVVRSVDAQAKALEHRGLLVRKLDSDVFELTGSRGRRASQLSNIVASLPLKR